MTPPDGRDGKPRVDAGPIRLQNAQPDPPLTDEDLRRLADALGQEGLVAEVAGADEPQADLRLQESASEVTTYVVNVLLQDAISAAVFVPLAAGLRRAWRKARPRLGSENHRARAQLFRGDQLWREIDLEATGDDDAVGGPHPLALWTRLALDLTTAIDAGAVREPVAALEDMRTGAVVAWLVDDALAGWGQLAPELRERMAAGLAAVAARQGRLLLGSMNNGLGVVLLAVLMLLDREFDGT